jgi:tetratricopeptide (TPR) repeat protein
VLEGSVRKAANRVRITAQLIDARNDRHLWSERYDRELTDIFAVQDEITEKIVGAVSPEFMAAEMHRARNKAAQNLDAWDLLMRAHWHLNRFNWESNIEAQKLLQQAIDLDPNSDLALSDLATSYITGLTWGWYDVPAETQKLAAEAARKATELNERNVNARMILGRIDIYAGHYDDAVSKGRKALELAPNSAESHGWLGGILMLSGERDAAISELEMALRLSPRDPINALWYAPMSVLQFLAGHYEESIGWCKKSLRDLPNSPPGVHRPMAASFAMLDRMEEARSAIESLQSRVPNVSIEATRQQMPFRREADMAHFLDALRKAGLPET